MITDLQLPNTRPKRTKKTPWSEPVPADFAVQIEILCFDQTINNTGVAILGYTARRGLYVDWTAIDHPVGADESLTSHELTYSRTSQIDMAIRDRVERFALFSHGPRAVVFERPAVGGFRTESALLAGYAIHKATGGEAVMVSNVHAKAVLLGPLKKGAPAWTKADVKRAVTRYIQPVPDHPWNEHVRDAIMLGLAHMFDLKKAADR